MEDKEEKTVVEPGEWQENGETPSLFVQQVVGLVEVFVNDDASNGESLFAGILLTPGQARSVAAKLIELANSLDGGK